MSSSTPGQPEHPFSLHHDPEEQSVASTIRNALFVCLVVGAAVCGRAEVADDKPALSLPTDARITALPDAVSKRYQLDTDFYKKHLDYKGFSILSSAKVSDAALFEARYLIDKLLGDREDIL